MTDSETVRFWHDPTDVFEYGEYTRDVRRRERADRSFFERAAAAYPVPPGTDTYWGDR